MDLLYKIKANLTDKALKRCIEQIKPQLEDPHCKPWLVIGVKSETVMSEKYMQYTQHLYPILCDSAVIAESIIPNYEHCYAIEVEEVRQMYHIQIKDGQ